MESHKFDMHVHTRETSKCGKLSGKDVAWCYRMAGYQGIMITDHYHKEYFDSLGQMNPREKIECYLSGYRAAKKEGDKIGLDVVLGIEFRNVETEGDFLVVGITEEFLYQYPAIYKLPLRQAFKLFHDHGMLVIQAHPIRFTVADNSGENEFRTYCNNELIAMVQQNPEMKEISFSEWKDAKKRKRAGQFSYPLLLRLCQLQCEDMLDGIEIYNGNTQWAQEPDKIDRILREHPEYLKVSASDFHEAAHLGRGGMVLEQRAADFRELKQILSRKRVMDWIRR